WITAPGAPPWPDTLGTNAAVPPANGGVKVELSNSTAPVPTMAGTAVEPPATVLRGRRTVAPAGALVTLGAGRERRDAHGGGQGEGRGWGGRGGWRGRARRGIRCRRSAPAPPGTTCTAASGSHRLDCRTAGTGRTRRGRR